MSFDLSQIFSRSIPERDIDKESAVNQAALSHEMQG